MKHLIQFKEASNKEDIWKHPESLLWRLLEENIPDKIKFTETPSSLFHDGGLLHFRNTDALEKEIRVNYIEVKIIRYNNNPTPVIKIHLLETADTYLEIYLYTKKNDIGDKVSYDIRRNTEKVFFINNKKTYNVISGSLDKDVLNLLDRLVIFQG